MSVCLCFLSFFPSFFNKVNKPIFSPKIVVVPFWEVEVEVEVVRISLRVHS